MFSQPYPDCLIRNAPDKSLKAIKVQSIMSALSQKIHSVTEMCVTVWNVTEDKYLVKWQNIYQVLPDKQERRCLKQILK